MQWMPVDYYRYPPSRIASTRDGERMQLGEMAQRKGTGRRDDEKGESPNRQASSGSEWRREASIEEQGSHTKSRPEWSFTASRGRLYSTAEMMHLDGKVGSRFDEGKNKGRDGGDAGANAGRGWAVRQAWDDGRDGGLELRDAKNGRANRSKAADLLTEETCMCEKG